MRKNNSVNATTAVKGNAVVQGNTVVNGSDMKVTIGDVINIRKLVKNTINTKKAVLSAETAKAVKADINASKKAAAEGRALKHQMAVEAANKFNESLAKLAASKIKEEKITLNEFEIEAIKAQKVLDKIAEKQERTDLYDRLAISVKKYKISAKEDDVTWTATCQSDITYESELYRALMEYYETSIIALPGKKPRAYITDIFAIEFPSKFESAHRFNKVYLDEKGKLFFKHNALGKFVSVANQKFQYDTLPNATEWVNISGSPSQQKANTCLFIRVANGKEKKVLDKASHGMFSKYCFNSMPAHLRQSATVRITSGNAPSKITKEIKVVAYDMRKLAYDGQCYSNGIDGQIRFGSDKSNAQDWGEFLPVLIKSLDAKPIWILRSKMTKEQEKQLDLALSGKPSDYSDKVVIIYSGNVKGRLDKVDILSDLNSAKAAYDYTEKCMLPVLDIPVASKSKMNTQLATKLLMADPVKAKEYIYNLLSEECNKIVDNIINEVETPYSMSDLDSMYLSGALNSLDPDFSAYDYKQKTGRISTGLRMLEKIFNKLSVKIKDSSNGRLYGDPAALFGLNILKYDEIMVTHAPIGVKGMLVKYPAAPSHEYLIMKTIGVTEYIKRINNSNLSEEQKAACIFVISNAMSKQGRIILPKCDWLLKLIAGSDFDFDGAAFIWCQVIMSIMENAKPVLVDIQSADPAETKEKVFGIDSLCEGVISAIMSERPNVGEVTNNYSVAQAMRIQWKIMTAAEKEKDLKHFIAIIDYSLKGDGKLIKEQIEKAEKKFGRSYDIPAFSFKNDEPVKRLLVKLLPIENRTTKYIGLQGNSISLQGGIMKYSISKATRERIFKELKTCIITEDNLDKILFDIEVIARYDQETTIDSVKKSVFVKMIANFTKYVNRFIKVEYSYTVEDGSITRNAMKLGNKIYLNDTLSVIRTELEAALLPKLQAYLDEDNRDVLAIKDLTDFGMADLRLSPLFSCKTIYGLSAQYIKTLEAEDRKHIAEMLYMGIYNMLRQISGLSGTKLGALAYYIATHYLAESKKGPKPMESSREKFNGFGRNVCTKEYIAFASKFLNKMLKTRDELSYTNPLYINDGDIITFVDNIAKINGDIVAICNSKLALNGEFEIETINGISYATKPMVLDFDSNYDKNIYTMNTIKTGGVEVKPGMSFEVKKVKDTPTHFNYVPFINDKPVKCDAKEEILRLFFSLGKIVILDVVDLRSEDKGVNYQILSLYTENIMKDYREFTKGEGKLYSADAPEEMEDEYNESESDAPEELEDGEQFDYSAYINACQVVSEIDEQVVVEEEELFFEDDGSFF